MDLHFVRRGTGRPLLLVHGLGGSWRSWNTLLDTLAAERDVIAVDLPSHGQTPKLSCLHSIGTLADAVTAFLAQHDLLGIDAVGSSMGARLVLELARRGGVLGAVVSLDPGGFWQGWQTPFFYHSVSLSGKLVTGPAAGDARAGRFGRGAHRAAAPVFGPALGRGRAAGPRRDAQLCPLACLR